MLESTQQQQSKSILNSLQYNCVRKIGKGGFGHVLLVTRSTSSSMSYAVKCLSKKRMIKDPLLKLSLQQQIETMSKLNHQNVVKLHKTFEQGNWHFLVLQYCELGNLYNIQSKLPHKIFPIDEALYLFRQILNGVDFIHKNKIIHRDLKLQNIFARKRQNGDMLIKIGDFGFARFAEETVKSNCGTQNYMAPEILQQLAYGQEVDVWPLGVILYYMLFGEFPFKGINILDEITSKCQSGFKLEQNLKSKYNFRSKKEQDLISSLFERVFQMSQQKRITVKELKEHPIFTNQPSSTEASTEEDNGDNQIEWELSQLVFLQGILLCVEQHDFLNEYLLTAFRFYIHKVMQTFLNKETIKAFQRDPESDPKLRSKINELISQIEANLGKMLIYFKKESAKEVISKFEEGLTLKSQQFQSFKVGYRNTIGKIYEEVQKKFPEGSYERATLKFKVFLCHIINRVFSGKFDAKLFPHFANWLLKQKKVLIKYYDFQLMDEWISKENIDKLNLSQEIINKTFYK